MELLMHLPKVVAVHVRVDLRRRDAGMAEHQECLNKLAALEQAIELAEA